MVKSKKEYLAWVNGGMMGTSWRAETIEEAVKTCITVAAQDWGGLRSTDRRRKRTSTPFPRQGRCPSVAEKRQRLRGTLPKQSETSHSRRLTKSDGKMERRATHSSRRKGLGSTRITGRID